MTKQRMPQIWSVMTAETTKILMKVKSTEVEFVKHTQKRNTD